MKLKEWARAIIALQDGKTPTCPNCGKHNVDCGYFISNEKTRAGYGVAWCEDCRHAFWLSRVKDVGKDRNILLEVPKNLIYDY